MKMTTSFLLIVVLFVGFAQFAYAQRQIEVITGLTTMYAADPLTQSICFRDGGHGHVFESGRAVNRCSDLNFGSYSADGFSTGVEGSRKGVLIDLGDADQLKARYGYTETVGKGQGYASIIVKNAMALIAKDSRMGTLQEMAESTELFRSPEKNMSSVPVNVGHIYLLRITDPSDKTFELLAKLIVVGHVPNESVTMRWQILPNLYVTKN